MDFLGTRAARLARPHRNPPGRRLGRLRKRRDERRRAVHPAQARHGDRSRRRIAAHRKRLAVRSVRTRRLEWKHRFRFSDDCRLRARGACGARCGRSRSDIASSRARRHAAAQRFLCARRAILRIAKQWNAAADQRHASAADRARLRSRTTRRSSRWKRQ